MERRSRTVQRGALLVAAGVLLVGLTFGGSWAFAPDVTKLPERTNANASLLVGVQGPGWGGNVTALAANGTTLWNVGNAISYQGVSRLDDGTVLATFADGHYRNCGRFEPPCKRTGVRFIDAESEPTVTGEWSYPVRTRRNSEVHDAEMLPSGEILVADMEYESIFTYNRSTGERTWTWNASQHYDAPSDPTKTDWLHINDVDRIAPGRFLVSVRNANQLLVVERGSGVVEVINRNRDSSVLDKQHNPHWLGDGAVVVADSENDRIVELHRNDSTGRWEVAWAVYKIGGVALDWPRDADRLPNGNTLVTDSRNDRVVEVTRNGSVASSYRVPDLPYEADRLPYGESFGRPYRIQGESTSIGEPNPEIPVLTPVLAGVRHHVSLPFWVSELHVFAGVVAVGCWSGGVVLLLRGRREGR